ncbi:MAG: hypothetical protein L0Z50_36355 [Verrucomicrobiales bacterium]|nr:hypothetical protein [Verrucomicrobiales bacterium]
MSAAEIAGMAVRPLRFQSQVVANGLFELTWTDAGQLERASNVLGPWTTVPGATSSPYSEPLFSTESRFFRLRASP